MAKRVEGCRLPHLAKRNSSSGLISYAKPVVVVGLEDISLTNMLKVLHFQIMYRIQKNFIY